MVMPTPEKLIKPDQSKVMAQKAAERNAKKKTNEAESNEPQTEANKLNKLHKQQRDTFIEFPVTIGMSGQVFSTGNIVIVNEAEKEPAFVDTIDNQPKVRTVKNFMIGPVFGDGAGQSGDQPNGIIQFINKKNDAPITEADQKKFVEIS